MDGRLSVLSLLLAISAVTLKTTLAQEIISDCSQFTTSPNDTLIARGGNECLDCTYSGQRTPRWQVLMEQSYTVISPNMEPDDCDCTVTNQRLCFANFDESAEGMYRCIVQIDSSADEAVCPFQINLASPPSISGTPADQTVMSGGDITLTVDHEPGSPPGEVTWYKDGSPLAPGGRLSISGGMLTISDAQPGDRGNYNFTVSNIGGSASVIAKVFVQFVEIDRLYHTVENGGIQVVCEGRGHPSDSLKMTVTNFLESSRGSGGEFDTEISAESRLTAPEDCPPVYTCEIMGSGSLRKSQDLTPDACVIAPTPPILSVSPINSSAVTVSWTSVRDIQYMIRYRIDRSENMYQSVTTSPSAMEIIITGLISGQRYTFEITADGTTYSEPVQSTVATCDASFEEPVTDVRASTVTRDDNLQTIRLTWAVSTEPEVAGYRVYVEPCPESIVCTPNVYNQLTYDFPPAICDGESYSFFVQSINSCGGGGPNSTFVVRSCDKGNQLTELKPDANFVIVKWSFTDSSDLTALTVTVRRVDEGLTLSYTVGRDSFTVESVCVDELEADTTYNVCLMPTFNSQPNNRIEHCMPVTTLDVSMSSPPPGCLDITSTMTPPPTQAVMFENWHIAIIVVGALAVVAMVFCLVGLCFACQSSKQKVDFGSNSSLNTTYNTSSIRDGVSIQRSNSPSRSCLSYHTKGHSTNWSDHVDTLRQMETDGGTHV